MCAYVTYEGDFLWTTCCESYVYHFMQDDKETLKAMLCTYTNSILLLRVTSIQRKPSEAVYAHNRAHLYKRCSWAKHYFAQTSVQTSHRISKRMPAWHARCTELPFQQCLRKFLTHLSCTNRVQCSLKTYFSRLCLSEYIRCGKCLNKFAFSYTGFEQVLQTKFFFSESGGPKL